MGSHCKEIVLHLNSCDTGGIKTNRTHTHLIILVKLVFEPFEEKQIIW